MKFDIDHDYHDIQHRTMKLCINVVHKCQHAKLYIMI